MLIARKIIKTSLEEIKDTIYWFEEKIKDFNIDGRIILVFNELLLNAYEHGNLSLGSKKKEELLKENCYEKELEKLQKKCNKKIYIYIYRYGNFLFTKIIDEGRGFDVSSIVSKKESFSGRGILISKKIADIFYNQKGNVVCFVMKIKKEKE